MIEKEKKSQNPKKKVKLFIPPLKGVAGAGARGAGAGGAE